MVWAVGVWNRARRDGGGLRQGMGEGVLWLGERWRDGFRLWEMGKGHGNALVYIIYIFITQAYRL